MERNYIISLCTPPTSVISCNFTWAWSVNWICERDGVAMSGKPEAAAGVVVDRLMHLMNTAGQAEYHGESVSQLEHALQTAELASREGGTDEQILAGLLHDLGHVWDEEGERELSSVGVVHHAHVGAKALKKLGFSDAVSGIVAGHVNAKRYLVGTVPEYAARLSETSVESLRLQGGPMGPEEAAAFSHEPYFTEKIQLRKWDDRAKIPGARVPELDSYRDMMTAHLVGQK